MNNDIAQKLHAYTLEVDGRLTNDSHVIHHQEQHAFYFTDIDVEDEEVEPLEPSVIPDHDTFTPDSYDEYIGAQIILPSKDGPLDGKVVKRLRDEKNGYPVGHRNDNPFLDTREYEVELADGTTAAYHANVLAENLFSQIDSEGRQYRVLHEIIDHQRDDSALAIADGWIERRNGGRSRHITTGGWKLLVEWKTGSTDWIPLRDLKESNPLEVADYAMNNQLSDEPAFAWWIHDVLRKRNRIISKVKSKYWKTSSKFGIKLPHSVEEAYAIDRRNGNDYWTRAIEKELTKIRNMNTFERYDAATPEELRSGRKKLVGYQEITCHMIFDIKMDGKFTRKARMVAAGHKTHDVPKWNTYATVVSRESVRIAFLHAALNNLEILGCDVSNAYLNAPCREKIWFHAGKEFGSEAGMTFLVKKALYGLKTSGFSWRQHLVQTLTDLGYKSCVADPDVYLRKACKPNGSYYYEMMLTYCLCISHKPKDTMDALGAIFDLKDTVKPPERYLGANIELQQLPDGRHAWSMSGKDYVTNSVRIVKDMLAADGLTLAKQKWSTQRPTPEKYRPDLDVSPELTPAMTNRFQQLIGILRWAVELGRVDILLEVSLLSTHLCLPREGHLETAYHIFAYLEKHPDAPLVFDDLVPRIDESAFPPTDWSESIYGDVQEELPPHMPEPLGNPVTMTCFVDASHAGDTITRRSQTGFIIYLNNAPIDWYSKRQNTVESSTFRSEFVATRTAVERVKALRYKLRMMGFPIDGPTKRQQIRYQQCIKSGGTTNKETQCHLLPCCQGGSSSWMDTSWLGTNPFQCG